MKKISIIFFVVICFAVQSMAGEHQLGVTVGSMNGISYKTIFKDNVMCQVDLGVNFGTYYSEMEIWTGDNFWDWDVDDILVRETYYTFELNPNFAYIAPFYKARNYELGWFIGGGASVGLMKTLAVSSDEYSHTYAPNETDTRAKIGINAIGGIDLKLRRTPISFSLDFRPGWGLTYETGFLSLTFLNFFDWKLAAGIRYCF